MFRGAWCIAARFCSVGMMFQAGGLSMVVLAIVSDAARRVLLFGHDHDDRR
jgi:hypothetical protein